MYKNKLTTRILMIFALAAALLLVSYSKTKEKTTMDKPQVQNKDEQSQLAGASETAIFAAGCFWHVEAAFSEVPGVISTEVGYTGGTTENPTYKMVCTDKTGHAEAVQVVFDPNKVSYSELLDVFWKMHDPTQYNRQGPDYGSQYRSVIFYHSPEQEKLALESKAKLEASHKYSKPVATQIVPAGVFYRAEEYHQKYFKKHGVVCSP